MNPSTLLRGSLRPVSVVTPATITHTGTDVDANSNVALATSITYTTIAVGDIVVLIIEEKVSSAFSNQFVSGISSTRVTWQGSATIRRATLDGTHGMEIWYGRVNSVGSDTATVAYTATTNQSGGSITSVQLHASTGSSAVWAVDTSNFIDTNVAATAMALPSLTAALAKEAIVGYCAFASSGVSGGTAGYTYRTDPRGNQDAYSPNVGPGAVTPAAWTGGSQTWFSMAALFQAT